uniref:Biotin carboxylation domain-containing protein n=1 Tax=Vitis vinifera TaxID=29760 RepID=A5AXF0_VITVI|nr:hypothetical protein VITISV_024051 [Vitis vinifera]
MEGSNGLLFYRNSFFLVTGHAFDARIYAENVSKGFLPVTGILHHYRPVPVSSTVWVETRVEQGDTVSMHYDPMIAKLVVWGENWVVALVKMKDCLSKFQFAKFELEDILDGPFDMMLQVYERLTLFSMLAVVSWITLLGCVHACKAFENGKVETHFIEHFKDDRFVDPSNLLLANEAYDATKCSAVPIAACVCEKERCNLKESPPGEEKSLDREVKVAHLGNSDFRVEVDGVSRDVCLAVYSKVCSDVRGPMHVETLGVNIYFVTFINDVTRKHNGVAEMMNRIIIERVRCILKTTKLPTEERSKLDDKVVPHVFFGYGDEKFGSRLWDLTKKQLVSRDVVFQENQTLGDFDKAKKSKGTSDEFIELVPIPSSLEQPRNEEKEIEELPRDDSASDILAQVLVEHEKQEEYYLNLELEQMDVKTTFLRGDLEEEIYEEQPEGF